ncbi:MAG: hypothetical protein ACK4FG_01805 [Brevundimonas sp.]
MPTGYTAAVQDGTITELKDFAFRCARAMGALVSMREMPMDAPIPERFEPSSYAYSAWEKATQELESLRAMTPEEWEAHAAADLEQRMVRHREFEEKNELYRSRYTAMIEKVEAWEGAPEGLKEFMLEQLTTSLNFDVLHFPVPEPLDRDLLEEKLIRDVSYYAEAAAQELNRTEARNAWVAQLRESLA